MRYMCLMKSSETNGEAPPAVYEAMAEYDRWGPGDRHPRRQPGAAAERRRA